MSQNLVFTNDVALALDAILDAKPHNHLAVIVDENTARVVLPEIRSRHLAEAQSSPSAWAIRAKTSTRLPMCGTAWSKVVPLANRWW